MPKHRFKPLEREQALLLEERQKNAVLTQPGLYELIVRLERIGGVFCPAGIEEDLARILSRGIEFPGGRAIRIQGEPSRCHSNAAFLWEMYPHDTRIATGYALSADGIWRQHSWAVQCRSGRAEGADRSHAPLWRVYETTEPRLRYYGFIMTDAECRRFFRDNTDLEPRVPRPQPVVSHRPAC